MDQIPNFESIRNVGFISTRLAGTDGVSLETAKWASIFEAQGFRCFYFAGEIDHPPERSYVVPEAHFSHPEIAELHRRSFDNTVRDPADSEQFHTIARDLKNHLYRFIEQYRIGLLIPENALTIPMHIPLGIAITQVIMETGMPAIAHHHDFYWERDRFMSNSVWDYLRMAFPPNLPSLHHVVINSFAKEQLGFRTGIAATIIPNIMDFEHPPAPPDDYAADVRSSLGIGEDELLVLQPTRVVARKGIEHAIELVHRLERPATLVISHASGDEGYEYEQRLKEYSQMMQVRTLFVSDIINEQRGHTADGRKIYTLADIYPHADLVTYPSTFEGFGNAFLEAVYFRKPIVVNTYSIYQKDIKPKGFSVIELDGYVTPAAVEKSIEIVTNSALRQTMVEHNYAVAKRFFSFSVLERRLKHFLDECMAGLNDCMAGD